MSETNSISTDERIERSEVVTPVMCRALIVASKRNGPVVLVWDWHSWPPRVRESRGWKNATVLYDRFATQEEIDIESKNKRCKSYVYDSIDALVADELRFGIDARALIDAHGT